MSESEVRGNEVTEDLEDASSAELCSANSRAAEPRDDGETASEGSKKTDESNEVET